MVPMKITDSTTYEMAINSLAKYDMRRNGGYKNQIIAERDSIQRLFGVGVRELRRMIAEYEGQI
jgi:hypothetical protein